MAYDLCSLHIHLQMAEYELAEIEQALHLPILQLIIYAGLTITNLNLARQKKTIICGFLSVLLHKVL